MSTLFLGADGRVQWETLVTGVLALVAAFFTAVYLKAQIRQTQILADDRRKRRERAALATLPLALSELSEYAIACIEELYHLRPYFRIGASADPRVDMAERQRRLRAWKLPQISDNILPTLKECIEFVDAAPAEAMMSIIRHLQIQRSRLGEYISRAHANDPHHLLLINIEHAMYDAAEIHAYTSTLFPFSRSYATSDFTVTRERVYEAFSLSGCFQSDDDISKLADAWQRESSAREYFERRRQTK